MLARSVVLAAIALCCWAGTAAADEAPAPATSEPIKIAVFAVELEDFTAAADEGTSPDETGYLAEATDEAKRQLAQSGRYSLIETAAADLSAAGQHGLRDCDGCEAEIAQGLGADQALLCVVTKISMTEYTVTCRISDAQNGEAVSKFSTGLRMGANYSWSRGVRSLMRKTLAAN